MKQDPAKQYDFEDLDHNIGGHEMGCNIEYSWILEQDQGDINTQMDEQEYDQEQSGQCHHQLLSDGRTKNVAHMY
jgi:hypothetical protein